MSQIKTRVVFARQDDPAPLFSTDLDLLHEMQIPGDPRYRYIHELGIGTSVTLAGKEYTVSEITTRFFDMEYKNESVFLNVYGERHPYNFEIVFKLRKAF